MRYVLLISSMFLLSCTTLFSQIIFYKYSKYTLEIDYDKNIFSMYIQYPDDPKVHMQHLEFTWLEYLAEGFIKQEHDFIICADTMENKHLLKFKQLSQFTLKVDSSSTDFYVPQDTLYAKRCHFKGFSISEMQFKNELPIGTWIIWNPPIFYSILYENGKIIKIENIPNLNTRH